ncbi:hypothetical protein KCA24_35670, partial [Escherichia coli]|nr:hypothetical protein [Escherichia coli]
FKKFFFFLKNKKKNLKNPKNKKPENSPKAKNITKIIKKTPFNFFLKKTSITLPKICRACAQNTFSLY